MEEPEQCVPSNISRDTGAISKASEPENIGGEKEGNTTQDSTATTTTTQPKKDFQIKPNHRKITVRPQRRMTQLNRSRRSMTIYLNRMKQRG